MSNILPQNQKDTLEDRLAKRRRLRNKTRLNRNSIDESETISINRNPRTTQSLDRRSSKPTSKESVTIPSVSSATALSYQRKSSATNSKLPSVNNSVFEQTHLSSEKKTNSTPQLAQISTIPSSESAYVKSLPINEQTEKHTHQAEKPIIKESVLPVLSPITEKPTISQQDIHENYFYPQQDIKPLVIKETVLPSTTEKSTISQERPKEIHENYSHPQQDAKPLIIKEIVLPLITEKSSVSQERPKEDIHEKPVQQFLILNRIQNRSRNSLDHPSSNPQSITDYQTRFNFPPLHPKPIVRTTSEQILPINRRKHQPIDSSIVKQNSLALSYLFNKRIIDAELSHTSSFDSKQSQRKTDWD